MSVYVVFWSEGYGDMELKKIFSTEEKANDYIKGRHSSRYWVEEMEVE